MYISHIYNGIYTRICMHLVRIPALSTVIRLCKEIPSRLKPM